MIAMDRFVAAVSRLAGMKLRSAASGRYPEIMALSAEEIRILRARACVPRAMASLLKRLWRRGHAVDGRCYTCHRSVYPWYAPARQPVAGAR